MSLTLNTNLQGADTTLGAVSGVLKAADTRIFSDDVVRMFHSFMASEFNRHADLLARANPDKYGHMYEWHMLGFKSGRLWNNELVGAAGKRVATYSFRPSVKAVPPTTPQNTGISSKYFPKLRNRKYVFVNKAMVFEAGLDTVITPKNGNRIFVPLRHKTRSGWRDSNYGGELRPYDIKRGFVWAKQSRQDHSTTRGNFTTLYLLFYTQSSERVFAESVKPRVEGAIRKVYLSGMPNLGGNTHVTRGSRNLGGRGYSVAARAQAEQKISKDMLAAIRAERMNIDMTEDDDE